MHVCNAVKKLNSLILATHAGICKSTTSFYHPPPSTPIEALPSYDMTELSELAGKSAS